MSSRKVRSVRSVGSLIKENPHITETVETVKILSVDIGGTEFRFVRRNGHTDKLTIGDKAFDLDYPIRQALRLAISEVSQKTSSKARVKEDPPKEDLPQKDTQKKRKKGCTDLIKMILESGQFGQKPFSIEDLFRTMGGEKSGFNRKYVSSVMRRLASDDKTKVKIYEAGAPGVTAYYQCYK